MVCSLIGMAIALSVPPVYADETVRADLVYVAIGSRHYVEAIVPDTKSMTDIRAANRSARQVSDLLRSRGAASGVLLTSEPGASVTRDDVFVALDIAMAEAAIHESPFVVFYVAGHGLSEGFAWTHLTMPGDVVVALDAFGDIELDLETAMERAIIASELVDRLNAGGMPYALILDTCYEGDPVDLEAYQMVFSDQNRAFLDDMADILRFMNQFHQPSPVIFSATPGSVVPTAPDPENELLSLAPMSRRLALLKDQPDDITLNDFVSQLTQPSADPLTGAGISYSETGQLGDLVLLSDSRANPMIEPLELSGSGSAPMPCCRAEDAVGEYEDFVLYSGRLEVQGPADEWVTDGRRHEVQFDDVALEPKALSYVFGVVWTEDDQVWTIEFNTGDGSRFEVGRTYIDQGEVGPQLSVSGDGRGCDADQGAFKVLTADIDETGLNRLEIEFRQSCDGDARLAKGYVTLERG